MSKIAQTDLFTYKRSKIAYKRAKKNSGNFLPSFYPCDYKAYVYSVFNNSLAFTLTIFPSREITNSPSSFCLEISNLWYDNPIPL